MAKVPVTIELPKEFSELADGIAALVSVLKPKLDDGLQPADAPAIIAAVVAFLPALKGVEQVDEELAEDPEAFAICGARLLAKIVKSVRAE